MLSLVVNAWPIAHIPTLAHNNHTANAQGQLNSKPFTILLDSGVSCSVLSKDHRSPPSIKPITRTKLVNANDRNITPCSTTHSNCHLGIIFSRAHFHCCWPPICSSDPPWDVIFEENMGLYWTLSLEHYRADFPKQALPLHLSASKSCNTVTIDEDCPQVIPFKCDGNHIQSEMPTNVHPLLRSVIREFKELFSDQLGQTNVTEHMIDTGEAAPIKVPPRQIPFYYTEWIHSQLQDMAKEGIIWPSTSSWCAPAVYAPKSSIREVRICVDFVKLNQVTKKDSSPVPQPEGP